MISSSIEIYTHLRKLLRSMGVSKRYIRVGAHLSHDLKLCPQRQLEWIRTVEEYFDIEIDIHEQGRIFRVSDMVNIVGNDIKSSRSPGTL